MYHENWHCLRCSNQNYETGEFRATGGAFAKIFDVQNKKFSTVTCSNCSFTEIYKTETSTLGNVFDFFTN